MVERLLGKPLASNSAEGILVTEKITASTMKSLLLELKFK